MVALMVVPLFLAACGGGAAPAAATPAPAAIDPEELRSLVKQAVQEAVPADSGEDLQTLIQEAIANSAPKA